MWKRLRVLLAFGLVPLVVFGNAETAAAANPWQQVEIAPSLPGAPDMDCWINLQHNTDGQTMNIGGSSACSGGMDITPGEAQWGEEGSEWAISVSGTTPVGDACGGSGSGTFGSHDSSGIFNVAGAFGSGTIELASTPTGCDVTQVCLWLFPGAGGLKETTDCKAVDFPDPIIELEECEYGDVLGVELISHYEARASNPGITDYWWEVQVFFTDGGGAHYDLWRISKNTSYSTDQTGWGVSMAGDVLSFGLQKNGIASTGDIQGGLANTKPKGIEVYALDNIRNTGTTYDSSALTNATSTNPTMPDGGYRGLSMPAYCRFYYGDRILTDPSSPADDPLGPLDDYPYVPPGGNAGPEPTVDPVEIIPEPIDSEPSFWSNLVGLIRKLLGAIANLVTGILDGLKALFIPDKDNWKVGGLMNELEEKPPYSIAAEMYDFSSDFFSRFNSAGSCGTLADFGGDMQLTCSKVTSAPGYGGFYNLVTAGFIALTGLGIFRMIQGLFQDGS